MSSSSTLVATVSINYEDFTEGFLTCGTCLYAYDQSEHAPKLLSCSHTICQSCLELIASSPTLNNSAEAGCIKCPICRQNIAIPSGGVSALPPSFLVNQLFDLVNKKPREFIPKCSVHIEQELLFCETCDCVFCDTCNNNNESDDSLTSTSLSATTATSSSSSSTSSSNNHHNSQANAPQPPPRHSQQTKQHISEACTVIPFSTAIKRMSEILSYRSQQCSAKLDEARDNVQREIENLESNCSDAVRDIGLAFEKIKTFVEARETQLLDEAKRLHEFKKNVLLEQLKTIESEKSSLTTNASVKINNETDVKNLSRKISDLTEKNDSALALYTPRENCFICFENDNEETLTSINEFVNEFGKIRTSKTYPPYCTSQLVHYSTHLRSKATVQSIDYNGSHQTFGGDPIEAELKLVGCNEDIDGEISITDKRDGTYEVGFVPPVPGKYQLFIYIFNRPIKSCPLTFETNSHHNPIAIYGTSSKKGVPDQFDNFSQPASLTINKHNGRVYILDSFNNRIKILAQIDSQECPFSFMQHIQPEYLSGRSCTGIALLYPDEDDEYDEHGIQALSLSPKKPQNPNILVTDWRNHVIYEVNSDGKLLRQYTHDDLEEPTYIAVDSRGRIFVVDRETIFIFNSLGKLLHKLTGYEFGCAKRDQDESSLRKIDLFDEPQKAPLQQQISNLLSGDSSSGHVDSQNKENQQIKTTLSNNNTATLNSYLVNAVSDKRSNAKTNTLSSLISMKRKPKLNPSSSLQRGSKAVMSAASRIRSTFTLSHSTSLVSAASLQSMFNNSNKQNTMSISHHQQQSFDSQSVSLNDNGSSISANKYRQKAKFEKQLGSNLSEALINQTIPIDEQREDEMTLISLQNNVSDMSAISSSNDDDKIEPFGIIRGIAIGPDDELIVADESRVRVIQPGDKYLFKRELFVTGNLRPSNHNHHNGAVATNCSGKLCGLTYDAQTRQLLTLNVNLTTGLPYIQVVDYQTGRAKFTIDSHESKLIRPSSLATYGEHVIVTDLGNDCIKKYRFY